MINYIWIIYVFCGHLEWVTRIKGLERVTRMGGLEGVTRMGGLEYIIMIMDLRIDGRIGMVLPEELEHNHHTGF